MKVIHQEIGENPIATIQIFLKGGIINENPSNAGITHMTMGLLSQGTKTRDAKTLSTELEDLGATLPTDTGYDYLSIGISALDSKIEKSAALLSDIIMNPVFDEKELEKEKMNVLAGLKSRRDQISTVAGDTMNSAFYGSHPYSWPEPGKASSVARFKREDLVKWHRNLYVSNNMTLVIAGKIKLAAAKDLAMRYFSGVSSGTLPAPAKKPARPEPRTITESNEKFQQAFLMIAFPAPGLAKDEFFTLKTLNGLLGGRMTGRLFMELREKLSLAYEVSSYYPSRKELSRFVIYIGLDKKNIPLALKRINEILDDLKKNPVSVSELTDTKNFIRGAYFLDRQTVSRKAWYIGWWETMGFGYRYDTEYLDRIMAVTPEDIQKAANKYFTESRITVKIVPGKPPAPQKKQK
jgi:predicted Zn-dependent peptidase